MEFTGYVNHGGESESDEQAAAPLVADGDASLLELPLETPVFNSLQVPCDVHGSLALASQHQSFARTESVLEMGMCGGPVVAVDTQVRRARWLLVVMADMMGVVV